MNKTQTTTLANGCFWCTEAIFQQLKGVEKITPGYSGGNLPNPTSEQVYSGETNHAESIQITYNPEIISYEDLLDVFWHTHNPTTLNRQGADVGTMYRSVVFYHDEEQKRIANEVLRKVTDENIYDKPIVTKITKFTNFYPAANYHKNYYKNNPTAPYCTFVIEPKLKNFWGKYKHLAK